MIKQCCEKQAENEVSGGQENQEELLEFKLIIEIIIKKFDSWMRFLELLENFLILFVLDFPIFRQKNIMPDWDTQDNEQEYDRDKEVNPLRCAMELYSSILESGEHDGIS